MVTECQKGQTYLDYIEARHLLGWSTETGLVPEDYWLRRTDEERRVAMDNLAYQLGQTPPPPTYVRYRLARRKLGYASTEIANSGIVRSVWEGLDPDAMENMAQQMERGAELIPPEPVLPAGWGPGSQSELTVCC